MTGRHYLNCKEESQQLYMFGFSSEIVLTNHKTLLEPYGFALLRVFKEA